MITYEIKKLVSIRNPISWQCPVKLVQSKGFMATNTKILKIVAN